LWIKANFSSQIQTEEGKTIDADGTEIDFGFSIPMIGDATHNIFMHQKISITGPDCEDGSCIATIYVVMTRTGVFYMTSSKHDDYGPGGGAFLKKNEKGENEVALRYGVQYQLLPDKGAWYDELRTEYDNPRKDRSVYPFVVIE
jgi:hypothetical protein